KRRQRARERKDAVDRKGIFRRVYLLGLSCLPRGPLQGSPCQTPIASSPGGRPQPDNQVCRQPGPKTLSSRVRCSRAFLVAKEKSEVSICSSWIVCWFWRC